MKFPGGKGGTYQKYINLMPPHEVYIESHLGGGAILRYKRRARRSCHHRSKNQPKSSFTNQPERSKG
ncbi:MAG: hypothetical protein K8R28_04685, partial [Desulfobacterales bacterium]|nr:hypothetical protein [Desulfobacterales bacterium]